MEKYQRHLQMLAELLAYKDAGDQHPFKDIETFAIIVGAEVKC